MSYPACILLWIFPVCFWMNEMHKFVEFYLIKLWLIYLFFFQGIWIGGSSNSDAGTNVHSGPWIFILFSIILWWVLINTGHMHRMCMYAAQSIVIIFADKIEIINLCHNTQFSSLLAFMNAICFCSYLIIHSWLLTSVETVFMFSWQP